MTARDSGRLPEGQDRNGLGASASQNGGAAASPKTSRGSQSIDSVIEDGLTFIQCGEPICEHDFSGWREFDDGLGGEQFCSKCGTGAMQWSMRYLP